MDIGRHFKEWKQIMLLACGFFIVLYLLSTTSHFVTAYQETKRAHILPTEVSGDGWENASAALTQDLPSDAPFASFNRTNSAFIALSGASSTPNPAEIPPAPPMPPEIPPTASSTDSTPSNASTTLPVLPEPIITPLLQLPIESASTTELLPIDATSTSTSSPTSIRGLPSRLGHAIVGLLLPVDIAFATSTNATSTSENATSANDTSAQPVVSDTTDVPTCSVLGTQCHTVQFSGFSVTGSLTDKKFQVAELNFSFGNSVPDEALQDGKLQVRYFHQGEWKSAGEIFLNKELSNAGNGGYFTATLDTIQSWEDLSDVKIVFEFVRGDAHAPAEAYLDAMWIDAVYRERAQDILNGTAGQKPTDTTGNVLFKLPNETDPARQLILDNGDVVHFSYLDALDDTLAVRADQSSYGEGGSGSTVLVSITNNGDSKDSFRLYGSFPGGVGSVLEISQYLKNVPEASDSSVRDTVTYLCDSGWEKGADEGAYYCAKTKETRACTSLNDVGNNCSVADVAVATSTAIRYTRDWVPTQLAAIPSQDTAVLDKLPGGYSVVASTDGTIDILPGQTLYFKAKIVSSEKGKSHFALTAKGDSYFGDLDAMQLRNEDRSRAEEKSSANASRINKRLSGKSDFNSKELPEFDFQYQSQRNILVRAYRSVMRIQTKPTVDEVVLVHHGGKQFRMPAEITYGENGEWHVRFKEKPYPLMPGEYTMLISVEEDGRVYEDVQTFSWGVLALNTVQSVYTPGDTVNVQMAALSPNGDTMCDADLALEVIDPDGTVHDIAVTPSGQCYGNNVVTVPDYASQFIAGDAGTYALRLSRLDADKNEVAAIDDNFEVRSPNASAFTVSRKGPTRIYPIAKYPMEITITTQAAFRGTILEKVPADFIVSQTSGVRSGDSLAWDVNLSAGETKTFKYTFDAPDKSPFLYLLGPLTLTDSSNVAQFTEVRQWQIASDAAGSMVVYWDDGATIPSGWTCVSCVSTDQFYQKFVIGSTTYGASSSVATFTHTATAVVNSSNDSATENFNNGTVVDVGHTHTFTPTVASTSSLPRYRQLRMIQSNSAGEPATIPAGAILIFDTTVPTGWTRYSAQDAFYIRGENTVGTTGGSNTHYHTVSGTTGAAVGSDYAVRGGGTQVSAADVNHTHSLTATSTSVENNEPPYLNVILGKLNSATNTPNDIISMWNGDIPTGWVSKSDAGGDFYNRFIKPGSTYGTTGGSSTHTHLDITGATTSVPSSTSNGRQSTPGASASGGHNHTVNISSFAYTSNWPPWIAVIFAKRHAGIPVYTQNAYRWYVNENAEPPTDDWPSGATDLQENEDIPDTYNLKYADVVRLRMNVGLANASSTVGGDAFKLQYAQTSSSCSSGLTWYDLGSTASTTALWRGYDNAGVANGATLSSTTLSQTNNKESYVEQNNSPTVVDEIGPGKYGEWDWVVQQNGAVGGVNYCFRMVRSDGSALDTYTRYPMVATNHSPATATDDDPFDNEATTTLPHFQFHAIDGESQDIDYQLQVSTNSLFTSTVLDINSIGSPTVFENELTPNDHEPFNSGDTIQLAATSSLTNNTTYWWRIRGKDVSGSNVWGDWATAHSFTVDTTVSTSTWFQTTDAQFATDSLAGATTTGSNSVQLEVGSSTGSIYSSSILFSSGFDTSNSNAWGSFSWHHSTTTGSILYHVEYLSSSDSSWHLIPDSDLATNSTGFTYAPVNLLAIDPGTYSTIRVRADLTNSGGTPTINDWTVRWGTSVNRPTLTYLFDNEKTGTTTPTFQFTTTDPQSDDLVYSIEWTTDSTFGTGTTTRTSDTNSGFTDIENTGDTSPFTSGKNITFKIQQADALTNGTTYWWRVRAKDPTGGNSYSQYSTARSFTVDTSVSVSTWFQTTNAQFNTDSLTGLYAVSNSMQVATSVKDVLIAYGEGTSLIPRYRIWDGTSWGSQAAAVSTGSQTSWVVTKAHPHSNEYALGTQGADSHVHVQMYQSSAWGNLQLMTTAVGSANARGFDIAYESLTGRLLAVYCDGDANPSYRIFDGTSWGSAFAISTGLASNCNWIKLASDPVSDEIIMLMQTADGNTFQAQVWSGSAWGNSTTLSTNNTLTAEAMAVEYEESGGDAVIVSSNGKNSNIDWRSWNGSAWTAAATQAISGKLLWGTLRRDTGTDNMVLSYIDSNTDVGTIRWNGSGWTGNTANAAGTADTIADRAVDAAYETSAGRDGFIMLPYSDTTSAKYQFWNGAAWSAGSAISTIARSATVGAVRSADGLILAAFLDHVNTRLDFSFWNGSVWSTLQTLESSPSVTSSPYKQPFMMAPRNSSTSGTAYSSSITFTNGVGPKWDQVTWSDSQPGGSTIKYHVQYYSGGAWALIPDAQIANNAAGVTTSPITLSGLSTSTYGILRLQADFACNGATCPILNDWTVKWYPGITISGTAKQFDQSTNVNAGTVAVAVNGTLQSGKTGLISGGTWSITNVTVGTGDIVTVYVVGASTSTRAVAVTKYAGDGTTNLTGMSLNELHLTLGSDDNPGLTNANLSQYDNSVSGNSSIFFDVSSGNTLTVCATTNCQNVRLLIKSGTTYRPDPASAGNVDTPNIQIDGTFMADNNTIRVSRSWKNNASFISGSSTVIFTATSTTETIDSSTATSTKFNVITFGETSGTAQWNLANTLNASSTLSINFGTLAQGGANQLRLDGDLTIGASGLFARSSSNATTSFMGGSSSTWTDNSASKQDMGYVLVDGQSKTVTMGSNVKATNITIGSDDTLDAGSNRSIDVLGDWTNNNTFTAQSGTVNFVATTTGRTIKPNTSSFYNLTFNGSGGNWAFSSASSPVFATTTNNFTITLGTVTLPTGTTTVGGSWDTSGGAFQHNNSAVLFNATASGKTINPGTSSFYDLNFNNSSGGWTFSAAATSSRNLIINNGTVTGPAAQMLTVAGSFANNATFTHNNSTLRFTGVSAQSVKLNGSSAYNMTFNGVGGTWAFVDTNATSTASVLFQNGTTTLPSGSFAVGRDFTYVSGGFVANGGTVRLNATTTGFTINPGSSLFYNLLIDSSTGGWTMSANATSTNNTVLNAASSFTLSSGKSLQVLGQFTTAVATTSTTWTGSTLFLSATSTATNAYSINTKGAGAATYSTLLIGTTTQVRLWNSSAATTTALTGGSAYEQNYAAVSGALNIYGAYTRSSGSDYWSYATDFDGVALGASRAATVRVATSSSMTFSGGTLNIIGISTASTTITDTGTNTYAWSVSGGTLNAQYYTVSKGDSSGLSISGTTAITSLADGDFTISTNAGSAITVASTVINVNPALQIFRTRFATTSVLGSAFNVTETGSASSFWWFRSGYGNLYGEAFDTDPGGDPGYIQFDDSGFTINVQGHVYSDHGSTAIGNPPCDGSTQAVKIVNSAGQTFTGSCASGTGLYTISSVRFQAGSVLTAYLDTNGGKRAVTVTKNATADINDLDLYQNSLIVRHEDATPLTVSNLATTDFTYDPDIPFNASSTLIVKPDTELYIWGGKSFTPGATTTLQSGGSGSALDGRLYMPANSILTEAGVQPLNIGGSWFMASGARFNGASTTVTMTATTTGKSIQFSDAINVWNLTFNGSGGQWSMDNGFATTTVTNAMAVTTGTIIGRGDVIVSSGGITGNGTITMSGGMFRLDGTGNIGNSNPWQFYNLKLGTTSATTITKTGSATTTINSVLTIQTNATLNAGGSPWVLVGGGTPFSISGTFTVQNSPWYYVATTSTTVAATTYGNLTLAPWGTTAPTYTLGGGAITAFDLRVATDTSSVTVNATTNDPSITLNGSFSIASGSTYTASDIGAFSVARNWTNSGTFTHSSATVLFNATTTGWTINPGSSVFYNTTFNGTGGWTISQNATSTHNATLTAAGSFTLASGKTLQVDGTFTNSVGGTSTTWTGSILYLNGRSNYTINTKTTGGDMYGTVIVGTSTDIRAWASDATTTTTLSSGSMYSQNNASSSGALAIYGAYTRSSGSDYWDDATDFDGTDISATPRKVNVSIASSSSLTFSGGLLDIIGIASASTTIQNQGTGAYAFSVSGGTLNASYYEFRNMDANGVNISGTPSITSLSHGDFLLTATSGTAMKVASTVLETNPLKIIQYVKFATTSATMSGYNVTETGTPSPTTYWKFNLHYGNLAGEAFDNDPGPTSGDPGFVRWDDSAGQITIQGNVYSDEGSTVSAVCDNSTQVVRLKVEGAGNFTSSCNSGSGLYQITGVSYNPGDTLTVYLDTNGGVRAANVTVDPSGNISSMDLYENRVIVRHEDVNPMTITAMAQYDSDQDTDIPFNATVASPNTLVLRSNTKLIVWDNKTFAPGGNVTIHGNAQVNTYDGSLEIRSGATFSATGAQTHTLAGYFTVDSGGTLSAANSTFVFNATTSGKTITPNSSSFYHLTFNGTNGNWAFAGNATTTGNFTISAGTVTLTNGTTTVTGSFNNTGGTIQHNNGTILFNATTTGKTVRMNGSTLYNMVFNSSAGGWSFSDTDATSTNNFIIDAGTVTMPTGIFSISGSMANAGTMTANNGTVRFTSLVTGKSVLAGGSSFYNLMFKGVGGTWTMVDSSATAARDLTVATGTVTFPASLGVGGSFLNTGSFTTTGTTTFNATTTGFTIDPGQSSFYDLVFNSSAGGWTITQNATSSRFTQLTSLANFTLNPGKTLAVQGQFTNSVSTGETWTGSTLYLTSGSYTINSKSAGGATYGTILTGNSMAIRAWGSSVATSTNGSNSYLYSQNNGGTSGALNIYGAFSIASGSEYWSYATDFDGTALGGSSRQVNVRIATSSSVSFSGGTLNMVGVAAATTTVQSTGTNSYAFSISGGTLSAQYYRFTNMDSNGLSLSGTPTMSGLDHGDFTVNVASGTAITLAGSVIDANASLTIPSVRFATTSPFTTGFNVMVTGSPVNSWTFSSAYGAFSGEAYDGDGTSACGHVRWDDSSCLFISQAHYRWRNDDGGEGALNSTWYDQSFTKRKKIVVRNQNGTTYTDIPVKIDVTYDSDMRSDFRDLRFTDSSGTTVAPFWTEASTTATSTVWVKVPSLPSNSSATIYMYYGSSTAAAADSATNTFFFADTFDDGDITDYSGTVGEKADFTASSTGRHNGSYGLSASAGNEGQRTLNGGIFKTGSKTAQGYTIRYFQYVNAQSGANNDEPCALFALQAAGQDYGVCLEQVGGSYVGISKNVKSNATQDGATSLATTNVTWVSGWYEVVIDWLTTNAINVNVYNSAGTLFATVSVTDSTYTSAGGMGFTFFGQHGAWDSYMVKQYTATTPTYIFGGEQTSSGATWKAAEDTAATGVLPNTNVRLRFSLQNTGTAQSDNYRLQMADKAGALNCESVPYVNYSDMPGSNSSLCSTADACMASSTQFTLFDGTSPLMSYPATMNFTSGEMLQGYANESHAFSLPGNTETEVEYNFKFTNNAQQSSYCFRTTNGGLDLANYDHMAEVTLVHPPFLTNLTINNSQPIILVEGATTTVIATSTVTDYNGYTDINSASSTIFRSGVGGSCASDPSNCYRISSSSCTLSSCSGNSCTMSCRADIYYFAEPTDSGTYAAENWLSRIEVYDNTGYTDTQTTPNGVEVQTVYALDIHTGAINFGSLYNGQDTGSYDATSTIANSGNAPIDIQLSGTSLTGGVSTIPVGQEKYATSTFVYSSCSLCQALSGVATNFDVNIEKATTTAASSTGNIYWGISIPNSIEATNYSGTNTFFAVSP